MASGARKSCLHRCSNHRQDKSFYSLQLSNGKVWTSWFCSPCISMPWFKMENPGAWQSGSANPRRRARLCWVGSLSMWHFPYLGTCPRGRMTSRGNLCFWELASPFPLVSWSLACAVSQCAKAGICCSSSFNEVVGLSCFRGSKRKIPGKKRFMFIL